MFVRACRSATIRTRLDLETVHERLRALAADPPPEGSGAFIAGGTFLDGGTVGRGEFRLDYHLDSAKNAQTYAVHGRIQDTPDWRVLRLKLTAHDPWLGPIELFFFVSFVALHVVLGEMPARGGVAILLFLMGLYAVLNLFWVPDLVTNRVSGQIASALNGSVLQHTGDWVVPK